MNIKNERECLFSGLQREATFRNTAVQRIKKSTVSMPVMLNQFSLLKYISKIIKFGTIQVFTKSDSGSEFFLLFYRCSDPSTTRFLRHKNKLERDRVNYGLSLSL